MKMRIQVQKHEDCDIEWLTNDAIERTSLKLMEIKERLKRVFDLIVIDIEKEKAGVDSTVQITESKSKASSFKDKEADLKNREIATDKNELFCI